MCSSVINVISSHAYLKIYAEPHRPLNSLGYSYYTEIHGSVPMGTFNHHFHLRNLHQHMLKIRQVLT